MIKNDTALANISNQSAGKKASRRPPKELMVLQLSAGQRTTVLKYATLPDYLAIKVGDIANDQFTPDEMDELLDHVEDTVYCAKGNEKQKLLRIVEKISKLLGSNIDCAQLPKRRTSKRTDAVFQVKITLKGIDPPIWRRFRTKDCTLQKLHALIQVTMGWEFGHAYRFEIGGVEFVELGWGGEEDVQDARKARLSDVIPANHRRPRFYYEYDFGDDWRHQLIVEERLSPQLGLAYPVCIAGARACPPEDCGGTWGYQDLLEALRNPDQARDDDRLEWFGADFDPEAFDLEAVNKRLANIR